jgi:predicted RNA-binding protein YlxR (DUF448 family)
MAPANSPDVALTGIAGEETAIPETDGGPARGGGKIAHDPQRRCIATMESRPQAEMVRFVLSPAGEVTPDLAARLPGRGAWVTSSREAIELAVKKGAFARAFKAQAKAAPDLAAQVESLLVKRALDGLGLAKRAGDLILGFEAVREAIRKAAPACLLEASDGAEDGRAKVLGLVRAAHGPGPDAETGARAGAGKDEQDENHRLPPVAGCFSAVELGMALGRGRVIHACLKQGRFAQGWMGELARLSGFRRVWLADWLPSDRRPAEGRSADRRSGANN